VQNEIKSKWEMKLTKAETANGKISQSQKDQAKNMVKFGSYSIKKYQAVRFSFFSER